MIEVDVAALAHLARLEVSEEEAKRLSQELSKIIDFVEDIQRAGGAPEAHDPAHRNVMRDDAGAHEAGLYTERLLSQAPSRTGDRVAVTQVVSRTKK